MFGGHFYPERIRKSVAVFGSLFNNLNVIRKSSAGAVLSQVKVPLSYSPKRDFLSRLDGMANGEEGERQIAVKLPRMSFEIVSMNYDPSRQLPKMNHCIKPSSTVVGQGSKLYTPVPYLIQFQLNIYSKSQDDGLQIVEQVVPFFTPHYTLTVKPLTDYVDMKEDNQITLQGMTFSDDYEASLESRRTIIYTLDFDMKVYLYKDASAVGPLITEYEIDFLDFSPSIVSSILQASPLTGTTFSGNTFTASNFNILNSFPSSYGLRISANPTDGVAEITYSDTLTSINGTVITSGTWSYTSNAEFVGADTFGIELLYGDSDSHAFNINMTIESIVPLNLVWTNQPLDAGLEFADVAWSPELGLFCAIGDGVTATSSDGITWTSQTRNGGSGGEAKIIWAGGSRQVFVVLNTNQQLDYSSDGINWTFVDRGPFGSREKYTNQAYSPSLDIFVSGQSGTSKSISYSTTLTTWVLANSVGNIPWRQFVWAEELGIFAGVAYETVTATNAVTSTDGITWTTHDQSQTGMPFYSLSWSGSLGLFVAVGSTSSTTPLIGTSTDGQTYTLLDLNTAGLGLLPANEIRDVTWSDALGIFVAVSDTTSIVSSDGFNWTIAPIDSGSDTERWSASTYSPELDIFVKVGERISAGDSISIQTGVFS